jgi:hypothetical protein
MPSCCESHRQRMVAFFADAKAYPENHELLLVIGQTLWIQLPEARCQVPMEAPRGSYRCKVSRLMDLEWFLRSHKHEVILGSEDIDEAIHGFRAVFGPSRHESSRQGRLRALIRSGKLTGNLGSRPERNVGDPRPPQYCGSRRPFCTPTESISATARQSAPDTILGQLGLQFDPKRTFVELIYEVSIPQRKTMANNGPAVPTVVDSEGYWLFRPNRIELGAQNIRWNMTRDITTDKPGHPELVYGAVCVSDLIDLVVWPQNTKQGWSQIATATLTNGNYPNS